MFERLLEAKWRFQFTFIYNSTRYWNCLFGKAKAEASAELCFNSLLSPHGVVKWIARYLSTEKSVKYLCVQNISVK